MRVAVLLFAMAMRRSFASVPFFGFFVSLARSSADHFRAGRQALLCCRLYSSFMLLSFCGENESTHISRETSVSLERCDALCILTSARAPANHNKRLNDRCIPATAVWRLRKDRTRAQVTAGRAVPSRPRCSGRRHYDLTKGSFTSSNFWGNLRRFLAERRG